MDVSTTYNVGSRVSSDARSPAMFARYRDGLERELRAAVMTVAEQRLQGEAGEQLYSMLCYHMGWADEKGNLLAHPISQGKGLRPTLCLFTCEALTGDWARALPAAAALELVHNFSLIHDDIQDGDLERHHRATVWALWGQSQGIVAGNAMRCLADMLTPALAERGVASEKALRASERLTDGYLDMTRGQCLDLSFEGSLDICLDDYLGMVSSKTAALLRCAMEIGALVASDNEELTRACARCGAYLGLAFQIRDDILGIWGEESETGKAVGNDIRRKKKSFPIVYALAVAESGKRQKLLSLYEKQGLDDGDVDEVLALLSDLGVAGFAHEMTCEKAGLALNEMRSVPLPSWAWAELEELVDFISKRQY